MSAAGARRQRGAALLMAIFVVSLATVIVSGLFWRQFVQLRTIENQQVACQGRQLLLGALSWARAILRQQPHPSYDALSDPWAQPMAATRLDELGETSALAAQATLSGHIEDAQARFNLANLVAADGTINAGQLAVLARLAGLEGLPDQTAAAVADYLLHSRAPAGTGSSGGTAAPRPLPLAFSEDLLNVPGIDPLAARALAPFVIVLDQSGTLINFNTAPAELMAAAVPGLSLADARSLAQERDQAYFKDVADLLNRLHGRGGAFGGAGVAVGSQYFLVEGTVELPPARTRMQALVRRQGGQVDLLWEREQ